MYGLGDDQIHSLSVQCYARKPRVKHYLIAYLCMHVKCETIPLASAIFFYSIMQSMPCLPNRIQVTLMAICDLLVKRMEKGQPIVQQQQLFSRTRLQ